MIFDFRLRVFHTVAHRLSFTKAAGELFITQPAVTKHIHELEAQFATKLFERRGNSIVLTAAGQTLLDYTHQLEGIYNRLEQDMHALTGMVKGSLHIGASTTVAQYVLPPLLAAFHAKHTDLKLTLTTGNTEHIEQALFAGSIDLGFIEGHTQNRQIKYVPFRKDEIVLTGKATHPFATKRAIKPNDLLTAPLVMREPGSGTLEVVMLALKKAGLKWQELTVEMQLDSTEAIKSYLLHSDCLAFVSRYAIRDAVSAAILKIIPVTGLQIPRPLNLIHLQGAPSRLAETFMKFALRYNLK